MRLAACGEPYSGAGSSKEARTRRSSRDAVVQPPKPYAPPLPCPHLLLAQLAEHHHLIHAVQQLGAEVGLQGRAGGEGRDAD